MSVRLCAVVTALCGAALLLAGCGGGSAPPAPGAGTASSSVPAARKTNVSLDKNAYPVLPDADAGANPTLPAEQGGKGFKGDGWETGADFDLIGDPHAVKG